MKFLRAVWVLVRAAWMLLRVLAHLLGGMFTIAFSFPRMTQEARNTRVQVWSRGLLDVLGITLEVKGAPPSHGPLLLVANHISWLDILVMHAARHCRFVAKAGVKKWPLIGMLATGGGTIYIERESRRDAMRVVHHIADRLHAGDIVAVFPEGTTSDGVDLLPFHGNLIQAAISAEAPVLPVGLAYLETATRARSFTSAYIGDDTLVGSLWKTLAGKPVTAVVHFGEPQRAQGRDRRVWAVELRAQVDALRRTAA